MKTPRDEEVYAAVLAAELEIDAEGRIWRVRKRCWSRWELKTVSRPCPRVRAENDVGDYLMIRSMWNGERACTGAHRLVFRHFKGPIPKGLTVNHDNGKKKDNRPDNLLLATYSEQMKHAYRTELKTEDGESNKAAKITDSMVVEIREEYALGGVTQREIADRIGVKLDAVSKIVRGKRRRKQEGPTADYTSRRIQPDRNRNSAGQFTS
jgi:predicted XRE-type DNA-binding protein